MRVIFLLLNIALCYSAFSQSTSKKITGTVTNEKNEKLDGTIILLYANDSTFLGNGLILDGICEFEYSNTSPILAKITIIGYQDTSFLLTATQDKVFDFGAVVLKSKFNTLAEIEILGRTETFETSSNGVIKVNVNNTILASSSSGSSRARQRNSREARASRFSVAQAPPGACARCGRGCARWAVRSEEKLLRHHVGAEQHGAHDHIGCQMTRTVVQADAHAEGAEPHRHRGHHHAGGNGQTRARQCQAGRWRRAHAGVRQSQGAPGRNLPLQHRARQLVIDDLDRLAGREPQLGVVGGGCR